MVSFSSPFGASDDTFDPYDEFVPAHIPTPGEFLDGHDVVAGQRHLAFHRLARELFEERAVYDMTFGYNLARLNCDRRHSDAGYRYALEDPNGREEGLTAAASHTVDDDARVLRASFTPTTAFCPQSDTLSRGSFRAWNGLADCHEFDLVRVRVAPVHQRAAEVNAALCDLESAFVGAGDPPEAGGASGQSPNTAGESVSDAPTGSDGSGTPF